MFIVTTFEKMDKVNSPLKSEKKQWDLGSIRTIGMFEKFEDAEKIVKNNHCDICETIYNFAIVEKIQTNQL
jgi:hypothetical protein